MRSSTSAVLCDQILATAHGDHAHVVRVVERARHGHGLQPLASLVLQAEVSERGERVTGDEDARGDSGERAHAVHETRVERVGWRDLPHDEAPTIEWNRHVLEGRDGVGLVLGEGETQAVSGFAKLLGGSDQRGFALVCTRDLVSDADRAAPP